MEYTIVLSSTASDLAVQYITLYFRTAIAEFFMQQGRDVLIVYDDLSKHAVAYRTMSLLLERSPDIEHIGDVFIYIQASLRRSCRLDDAHGGGSIALPIIETLL